MSVSRNQNTSESNKFRDPFKTANGETRAFVDLKSLDTLWINTGTLCNIACTNCYIESSPYNDRLAYVTRAEIKNYLHEIIHYKMGTRLIGFTGGEPFMNPDFIGMLEDSFLYDFDVLILTNAMKPLHQKRANLLRLQEQYPTANLTIRVSIDHYDPQLHEKERGSKTWQPMIEGLIWLSENAFEIKIAGRSLTNESESEVREGFGQLFKKLGLNLDSQKGADLVLFPEMNEQVDIPEITEQCWDILSVSPKDQMCHNARMIVKRKGSDHPSVVACTLLPYDAQFELGIALHTARQRVQLNHPHCAKFCVLGGATCNSS